MNEWLVALVPTLAQVLLQFLWQGLVIGCVTWLLLTLLRDAKPQLRYAVACVSLLLCALLPAWGLLQALGDVAFADRSDAVGHMTASLPAIAPAGFSLHVASPPHEASPWIVAAWSLGALLMLLRLGGGVLWVKRQCATATEEPTAHWQPCMQRIAAAMGIRRVVALRMIDNEGGPLCAGWWKPVVLLPIALAAGMPRAHVEALIAHELAHIRRHDYLVNLLQGVVEALLFYHPTVWWLSRRIRIERELVADELAAAALGERRTLALALAELDRFSSTHSLLPLHFAQAAHGGELMSRIRQLIRPARSGNAAALMLPVLGVAVVGLAFYAQARSSQQGFLRIVPTSTAQVAALPVPLASERQAPDALPAPRADARIAASGDRASRDHDTYALIRKDEEGITMSGSIDDVDQIKAARGAVDGDFLWFRRDGKAWIVRDPDTLAQVRQAWAATDVLDEKMEALDARMDPHERRIEALSERMDAISDADTESPEVDAISERMSALGEESGELAERQAELSAELATASDDERGPSQAELREIESQQRTLASRMQRESLAMEAAAKRMEQRHAPMEALSREMEAASQPMEALAKDMEAVSKQMERESEAADAKVRGLIERAYSRGLATPAPAQQ